MKTPVQLLHALIEVNPPTFESTRSIKNLLNRYPALVTDSKLDEWVTEHRHLIMNPTGK